MLFRWSLYLITFGNPCMMFSHPEVICLHKNININSNLINTAKSECDDLNLNIKASFKGFWSGKTCMKIINYVKQKICVCLYLNSTWCHPSLHIDRVNKQRKHIMWLCFFLILLPNICRHSASLFWLTRIACLLQWQLRMEKPSL